MSNNRYLTLAGAFCISLGGLLAGCQPDTGDSGSTNSSANDSTTGQDSGSNIQQGISSNVSFKTVSVLSDTSFDATEPAIGIDSDGNVTAIWVEERSQRGVWSSHYNASDSTWSGSTQIDGAIGNVDDYYFPESNPKLITTGSTAIAAWVQAGSVYANVRSSSTGWLGNPETLDTGIDGATSVHLAGVGDDKVLVLWTVKGDPVENSEIQYRIYDNQADWWSATSTLTVDRVSLEKTHIELFSGSQGDAYLVYAIESASSPDTESLYVRSFDGSDWLSASLVGSGEVDSFSISDDPVKDDVVIAYEASNEIWVSREDGGNRSSVKVPMTGEKLDPEIATLSTGGMLLSFVLDEGYLEKLYTMEWTESAGWTTPDQLYDLGASALEIETDSTGRAVMIFRAYHSYMSTYDPNSGWSSPVKADSYNEGIYAQLEIDEPGTVIGTWVDRYNSTTKVEVAISK